MLIALPVVVVLVPFFIIIAIIILIDTKGPVFFVQERLGKGKKPFNLIKFRTMLDKPRDFSEQVFHDHNEITKVGNYLRRFKLDELPQIINVIKGEMAIVGPRPCLPAISHKFGNEGQARFNVLPGLTSLAALKGSIYLTWEQKGFYDKLYVDRLSFLLDLSIIMKTFLVIILGEKRYYDVMERNSAHISKYKSD